MYRLKVKLSECSWKWEGSRYWTFFTQEAATEHGVMLNTKWPKRVTAWAVWLDACLPGGILVATSEKE